MNLHPVAGLEPMVKTHRLPLNQNERHFGVGCAQGFDGILDAGRIGETVLQPLPVALRWEKVVEHAVKAEVCMMLVIFGHSR
jgi:hypothetical protein